VERPQIRKRSLNFRRMKRTFDFIVSVTGIAILMPFLLLIAILIKVNSEGPIFYKGIRLGKGGQPFKIHKFRTMLADAEKKGPLATPEDDQRITNVGKILRKFKLDEFPQLINVLKGEMSLVGPRPEALLYFAFYSEEEKKAVLSVRPGMTDYGSLRFHDEGKLLAGYEDPVKAYVEKIKDEKVKIQLQYIREQSFWTDLSIIFLTIKTIIQTRLVKKEGK